MESRSVRVVMVISVPNEPPPLPLPLPRILSSAQSVHALGYSPKALARCFFSSFLSFLNFATSNSGTVLFFLAV